MAADVIIYYYQYSMTHVTPAFYFVASLLHTKRRHAVFILFFVCVPFPLYLSLFFYSASIYIVIFFYQSTNDGPAS